MPNPSIYFDDSKIFDEREKCQIMLFSLFFLVESQELNNPEPDYWTGWSPSPSWGPTHVPKQTWPTNEAPWPPTRSKKPTSTVEPHSNKLGTVAIILITLGAVIFVAVIVVLVLYAFGIIGHKNKKIRALSLKV